MASSAQARSFEARALIDAADAATMEAFSALTPE
jgi:hypothetical protein